MTEPTNRRAAHDEGGTGISAFPAGTPRLTLRQDPSVRTILDGAWWPRSQATVAELTSLIVGLDDRQVPVNRIMLNPGAWDERPRRITVNTRVIRLGWFTTLDANLLIATTGTERRVDLLVVPSTAPLNWAEAAATLATEGDSTLRAGEIVSAVSTRASTRPPESTMGDAEKVAEGGRTDGHQPAGSGRHTQAQSG